MRKKFIVIIIFYLFQFVITSCEDCDCTPFKTFEKVYNELELKTWNTSGFENEEITNIGNIKSFGLTIDVKFELNQIALNKLKNGLRSFGFSSAYACDCVPDKYITTDTIKSILITVTDVNSREIIDVTDNFYISDYNGGQITVKQLFDKEIELNDFFQLDMIKYDNIPNNSIFNIKMILESGNELIKETQEISFE